MVRTHDNTINILKSTMIYTATLNNIVNQSKVFSPEYQEAYVYVDSATIGLRSVLQYINFFMVVVGIPAKIMSQSIYGWSMVSQFLGPAEVLRICILMVFFFRSILVTQIDLTEFMNWEPNRLLCRIYELFADFLFEWRWLYQSSQFSKRVTTLIVDSTTYYVPHSWLSNEDTAINKTRSLQSVNLHICGERRHMLP